MTAAPFDTLKLSRQLRERAHFDQEQAEGFAEALAEAVLLLADPVHAQAAQSCVESAAAATSNHVSTRAGLAIED